MLSILALVGLWASSASAASRASTAPFAQADGLYFSRQKAGRLEESLSLIRARLAQRPDEPAALWRLGRGLVRLGERSAARNEKSRLFDDAAAAAARAAELAPDDPEAHFWHGVALGRTGQSRGMMRSLFMIKPIKRAMERVLELDPGHGGAHQVLGELYRQLPVFLGGSRAKALEEMEAAVRCSPEFSAVYIGLARLHREEGRPERARAVLKRLLAIEDPGDPGEFEENRADARRMLNDLASGPGVP